MKRHNDRIKTQVRLLFAYEKYGNFYVDEEQLLILLGTPKQIAGKMYYNMNFLMSLDFLPITHR